MWAALKETLIICSLLQTSEINEKLQYMNKSCYRNTYSHCFTMANRKLLLLLISLNTLNCVLSTMIYGGIKKRPEVKIKCPKVRSIRNFDLEKFLGPWFVIQYYASSEEALSYRCMRSEFTIAASHNQVTMNFSYSFTDDPLNEQLIGNITWNIPDMLTPAHWMHSEDIYEGVYNTFVLDSDYDSWALLLHCAEKSKSPRYLSSLIMSRRASLGVNVISYLRDKLPRYDIDLKYMFNMTQNDCDVPQAGIEVPKSVFSAMKLNANNNSLGRMRPSIKRHPLKSHHEKRDNI